MKPHAIALVSVVSLGVFGTGVGVGYWVAATAPSAPVYATRDSNHQIATTSEGAQSGTVVRTSALSENQRALLHSLGIEETEITVTADMVACAEAKLGSARVSEIRNGATPSFSEGLSLVACYR